MLLVAELTESQFWPLEFEESAVAFIFDWIAAISTCTLVRSTPGVSAVWSLARMFWRSDRIEFRPL